MNRRRPLGFGTIAALVVGTLCAVAALFYTVKGIESNALFYAAIGLGVFMVAAWRNGRP